MQDDKEITDKAVSVLNRPVKIIDELSSRDEISRLIKHSYKTDKSCKDFIIFYRKIEPLFKSEKELANFFELNFINWSELENWANINNLKVSFLIGTEELSLRPIHFQIL